MALALMLAAVLSSPVACDRNVEPYPGDEAPREPDLSRIFPAPADPAPREREAMATQPVAQQTSRAGSAKGPTISGEIRLAGGEPPAGAMLFVIARAAGTRGGPPLAVLRVPQPQFPYAFELSQANVMIPSLRFSGEMDVTARLDVDGNAMTKDAADLEGRADAPRKPGDSGVVVVLAPAGA
jgi:hypothetical protein